MIKSGEEIFESENTHPDACVLVVDDDEINRLLLVRHLHKQGITNVLEAENGREALDAVRDYRVDLVLLDVMMPEVDGYQVLEEMKGDPAMRGLPVIMITALNDMQSAVKCIENGAEDYLIKPFNPVLLRARIRASLEKKRLLDIEHAYLRFYDPATGLPNRSLFRQRLREELDRRQRSAALFSVLLVRINGYQMVSHTLGQSQGDEMVKTKAEQLTKLLPTGAVLARLAPTDFGVLVYDLPDPATVNALALEIQREQEEPVMVGGHEVSGKVSIGIAFSSSGYRRAESMLRDAGLAANKLGDRGGCEIFDDAMHVEALKRLDLEPELRLALADGHLVLYYQPIVEMNGGRVRGFEALIRWKHPQKGLVPPGDFIKLAEETGLIVPIGTWVIGEACRQAAAWESLVDDGGAMEIGVNVSPQQFSESDFVTTVRDALAAVNLDKWRLKLEMTETALIDNPDRIERVLTRVHDHGVQTAIDDFGTGYCSLTYLHRLPFDTLKIDQSFVRDIGSRRRNQKIVQSTITLAHNLGMAVVAEGVETEAEAAVLAGMKCEYGQGMLFNPPMAAGDATRLLQSVGGDSGDGTEGD